MLEWVYGAEPYAWKSLGSRLFAWMTNEVEYQAWMTNEVELLAWMSLRYRLYAWMGLRNRTVCPDKSVEYVEYDWLIGPSNQNCLLWWSSGRKAAVSLNVFWGNVSLDECTQQNTCMSEWVDGFCCVSGTVYCTESYCYTTEPTKPIHIPIMSKEHSSILH
jgi:hypothetical protein